MYRLADARPMGGRLGAGHDVLAVRERARMGKMNRIDKTGAMTKWVYSFGAGSAEGAAEMRTLLGGKGANLAEMCNLKLPVPPGFTITTEVCTHYYKNGHSYPKDLKPAVDVALARVAEL